VCDRVGLSIGPELGAIATLTHAPYGRPRETTESDAFAPPPTGPLSAPVVPSTLISALSQEDHLVRSVHAAQTVVKLQNWHVRHGEYPPAAPETDTHDVEYETTNKGQGYRLRTKSEIGAVELFLERLPDVRTP
jgi:hypothetical protein